MIWIKKSDRKKACLEYFLFLQQKRQDAVSFLHPLQLHVWQHKLYHSCPKLTLRVCYVRESVSRYKQPLRLRMRKKYWGLRYFISHTKSQQLLVTRHRLSCEKVNSHNTLVTGAWDTCVYTRALHCLLCGHARWVWPRTVRLSGLCHWTRIRKNSWSTRSDLIPIALAYNGFQHISAVLRFWNLSEKEPKGRKFLFWAREAPKSHRWRKRKGEKERAKRRKVGDDKKEVFALLVFIMATLEIVFGRKKTLFDGRGLFGGKRFQKSG